MQWGKRPKRNGEETHDTCAVQHNDIIHVAPSSYAALKKTALFLGPERVNTTVEL